MTANGRQIAVVTGANRGIGREICRQLAQRGVHVVLTARNETAGRAAIDELARNDGTVEFYPLDVTQCESVGALAGFLERQFGRLDILVNNGAIVVDGDGDVMDIDVDTVRRTMETNCYGPFRISQRLMPLLCRSANGRLINISSGSGSIAHMAPDWAAYRLSKTYLNGLTAALASKLKAVPFRSTACAPAG